MRNWEYAFGTEDWAAWPGPKWQAESEPGTYHEAEVALMRAVAQDDPSSDYSLRSPCIVRRCNDVPEWQPVKDHTAELLAELLMDLRLDFATHGKSIMQGSDLARAFAKRARLLDPPTTTEDDDEGITDL